MCYLLPQQKHGSALGPAGQGRHRWVLPKCQEGGEGARPRIRQRWQQFTQGWGAAAGKKGGVFNFENLEWLAP